MPKFVEIVPNISEGRRPEVIQSVKEAAIEAGAIHLNTFTGSSTNRTVLTLVAPLERALEVGYAIVVSAANLIDMRHHTGSHPRMGATDVLPFIPLGETTMAECIEVAKKLGAKIGRELSIPVYLYGEAASNPKRSKLSFVRKKNYEGLPARINDPELQPDFGSLVGAEKSGAIAISARDFLIAYNINLATNDREIANQIAYALRENGTPGTKKAGLFSDLSAIGWHLPELSCAQISMNVHNFRTASLDAVYEAAGDLAARHGTSVTNAELVGLLPRAALDLIIARRMPLTSGETPNRKMYETALRFAGLSHYDLDTIVLETRIAALVPSL